MAIDTEAFLRLKRQADRARSEADKASGALAALKAQLEEKFGCKTLKEARKLLEEMQHEGKDLEKEFKAKLKEFQRDYQDMLDL